MRKIVVDGTGVLAVGDPPAQVRHAKFLLASICKFFYVVNETTAQPLSPRDDGFSFYPHAQTDGAAGFFLSQESVCQRTTAESI